MPIRLCKPKSAVVALASGFFSLLLMLIAPAAQAVLLKIDPARSEVHYTPPMPFCTVDPFGVTVCPPPAVPQVFTIGGDIELEVIHEHFDFGSGYPAVDRDLLKLQSRDLASEALSHGFFLDGAYGVLGLLNGMTFEVRDDPCFLFVGPGSCSGWRLGPFTGSNGTWDDHTLLWNGYQSSIFESFSYTITAVAIAEPATPLLLATFLLLGTLARRRRRSPSLHHVPR